MPDYDQGYSEERYGALGGQKILEKENNHYEEILENLGAEYGDSVLELGSNDALLSEHLSEFYDMTCADVERNPLMDAREYGRAENQLQVDAHRLPFQEDAFDYVVIPRVLHLDMVDGEEVLSEASRVAEKGFAFDVFSPSSLRAPYNPMMHRINEKMPKSNMHSRRKVEGIGPIDGILNGHEKERIDSFSDFIVPFGAFKKSDNESWVDFTEKANSFAEKWGKSSIPDLNSVNYYSVDLKDF
mgnify:FL=1